MTEQPLTEQEMHFLLELAQIREPTEWETSAEACLKSLRAGGYTKAGEVTTKGWDAITVYFDQQRKETTP
jgi:hypothetical protein